MKNRITLWAVLLSTFVIYAQDPNIIWQRTIGGSAEDFLYDLKQTPDGGYIFGGYSDSNISGDKTENTNGFTDIWLIKTDSDGQIVWQKTIGGNNFDDVHSIELTSDGGYILCGESDSDISGDKTENSRGFDDFWVVKLDSVGNVEWDKTIGGSDFDDVPYLKIASDGYYICGSSWSDISGDKTENSRGFSDYWLLKLDFSGNIIWQKTIGGDKDDLPNAIIVTDDGGCIIGGYSESNISGEKTENSKGASDYWIVKVDASGTIEWDKTIGGSKNEILRSLIQTSDNGFLLTGRSWSDISGDKTESSQGEYDFWIVKVDTTGTIEWDKTIGGNNFDDPFSAKQTSDGGYIIGGYSDSDISGDKTENGRGEFDFWLVKLNSVGIIEWQNTIGGDNLDRINAVIQENDGSYVLGGSSKSNISGDKTENSKGGYDFWIIKHAQTLNLETKPMITAITLNPNPAKNTLQLNTQDQTINQVNIYTMTGARIMQLNINAVSPTVDVSSLASGVYYIQLYSGKNVTLKKFVKD